MCLEWQHWLNYEAWTEYSKCRQKHQRTIGNQTSQNCCLVCTTHEPPNCIWTKLGLKNKPDYFLLGHQFFAFDGRHFLTRNYWNHAVMQLRHNNNNWLVFKYQWILAFPHYWQGKIGETKVASEFKYIYLRVSFNCSIPLLERLRCSLNIDF